MKVLLANSTCKVGGVSTFMLSLRAALVAQGHECDLFFFQRGTMEPHLPRDCRAHFGTLADCLRLVARERIDVVHANNIDWTTGISAVRHAGATLVLTAHKARESAWTYGWHAGNCDALTSVSDWIRAELQPHTDVPVQVVPNAIDIRRFAPGASARIPGAAGERPIVAWIGRGTSPLKGLDIFAPVARALHAAHVRVWILDQHGREKVAEMLPDTAVLLQPAVERWGAVHFDAMPALYGQIAASGGCMISTSRREGMPLALLEAQACGCPVIVSDVQGNRECVFPEHGGLLFPLDDDPEAIARLVVSALQDHERLRQRGRDAAAHVRAHFSLEQLAERFVRTYTGASTPAPLPLRARLRGRLRLSPLLAWRRYVDQRLGVGYAQFAASRELAANDDWRLAAAAGRAALQTSPTIYAKPQRAAHLLRCIVSGFRAVIGSRRQTEDRRPGTKDRIVT